MYPPDWPEIAKKAKTSTGWTCERCGHPHDPETGHTLTVHHLDGDKTNCSPWNLAVLCQRCHLTIQRRVKMNQTFLDSILKTSDWFKPHLEGYLRFLNSLKP